MAWTLTHGILAEADPLEHATLTWGNRQRFSLFRLGIRALARYRTLARLPFWNFHFPHNLPLSYNAPPIHPLGIVSQTLRGKATNQTGMLSYPDRFTQRIQEIPSASPATRRATARSRVPIRLQSVSGSGTNGAGFNRMVLKIRHLTQVLLSPKPWVDFLRLVISSNESKSTGASK